MKGITRALELDFELVALLDQKTDLEREAREEEGEEYCVALHGFPHQQRQIRVLGISCARRQNAVAPSRQEGHEIWS